MPASIGRCRSTGGTAASTTPAARASPFDLQRVEAVASQQDAFDDGLRGRSSVAAGLVEARRQGRVLGHGPGERGGGVAELGGGQVAAAGADGDDVGTVPPRARRASDRPCRRSRGWRASPGRRRAGRGTAPFSPTGTPIAPTAAGADGRRSPTSVGGTSPRRRRVEPGEVAAHPGEWPATGGEGVGLR